MEGEPQAALEGRAQPSAQLHGQLAALQAHLDRLHHLMGHQAEQIAALRQALTVSHGLLRDLHAFLEGDGPEADEL